ncbi:hypothetical protein QQZ08_007564 [Neonectria magnoliae]|uniref:Uncharacterized protein n=1 Tax=Neonectria magnoliae TaxID=2732573 RepID=A0ABR1HXP2_9HYPO
MASNVPAQQQALVLTRVGDPMTLETRPVPRAGPGSLVIGVLAASLRANIPTVYRNPESLMEGFDEGGRILTRGEWRDANYAEYTKLPLYNCHVLNEKRLFGDLKDRGLGYTLDDLTHLFSMLIPFGGLVDIEIEAEDIITIAPSTGRYGSAAVHAALAIEARVIAIGRNATVLSHLDTLSSRITTVRVTNDIEEDTRARRSTAPEGIDAFSLSSGRGVENNR